ncbi:hypothetical protein FE326_00395 [Dolosigranulum pigrum]|nr:hypothetical protein FE326_00395 [Dolosigranulum pigrum]
MYSNLIGWIAVIFRKYKYRSQINEKDCGIAALGMILDNYRR